MRLKTIRLAGFKSFVDPTHIPINGTLIGIVGPNGCGKSNIIDAVRWVMGEMSAKHLRGDSMADVVFNGSTARKPVGRAFVELVFDNSDGRAGGEYAAYGEISIRREAGRDGQSDYFLNKTRCRRKDITDIFLGTGLGPRAYSIIEQGMVTRIIEAKPEELRGFIEEAAGVSRYKERRRETETRIKHTQENLARVEDIRQELGTQLTRLDKQSKAAAKYKQLKAEERLVRAQLIALRYRELDEKLNAQDAVIRGHETALEALLAKQREIEAGIERLRAEHTEALDRQNAVQAEYYAAGSEISRLEQAIEHARETREALKREQTQLDHTWSESEAHLNVDRERLADLERRAAEIAPSVERLRVELASTATELTDADAQMQAWQQEWETQSRAAGEAAQRREIQSARIRELESHIAQLEERRGRLTQEESSVHGERQAAGLEAARAAAREIDSACAALEATLRENGAATLALRDRRDEADEALAERRGEQQSARARLASLRELQAAAAARHDAGIVEWLRARGLDKAPRLANRLQVDSGWETAVERVLGARLAAVCAKRLDDVTAGLAELKPAQLTVLDMAAPKLAHSESTNALLAKVKSDIDLEPLLAGVQTAANLREALARRAALAAAESIITPEGAWVGRNWLSLENAAGTERGWLAREREIEALETECAERGEEIDALTRQLSDVDGEIDTLEERREELTSELNERQRERAEHRERLGHEQERLAQLDARAAQVAREGADVEAQLARERADVDAAAQLLRQAHDASSAHDAALAELQTRRATLQERLAGARVAEAAARERAHHAEIESRTLQTAVESTRASIARIEGQLGNLRERREQLHALLADDTEPDAELRQELNRNLTRRLEIEGRLNEIRRLAGDVDAQVREREQGRTAQAREVQDLRGVLETERVTRQELRVRRDTHAEQIREASADLAQVLAEMPAEATEAAWQERLERVGARIERLGPINLVAIEEFEELSQRKHYLDKQAEDLNQALTTLQEAIRKMDRETRARFKETFDKVNENFQAFFPRLFGGGSSYLELTENDLLEAGVAVMARPPGKRNSTIHLLSGGEKALAAVALLFSIFELNPAPFCLLDEVDAPLDDANVERYCETLKTMSSKTQLVYVTHNKISMELADILLGVTMSEPGVSRLVAVDVEQAMQMVAQ
jgi:chromosome segregation protein